MDIIHVIGALTLGILLFVLIASQLVTLFFTTYQTMVGVVGMAMRSRIKLEGSHGRKFAVVICAHNEDAVVGDLLKNLDTVEYPKDLYDVFVIADNCTDMTAEIARSHGAIALERHDKTKVSKGYGIEWFLEEFWRDYSDKGYDAIAIFDADNIISRNFLNQANTKMNEGYKVIQAYLDSKNPSDTWVTKAYALSYTATSRVYQQARENIGLSAQLGGTGMVFDVDVLKEMGWGTESLTEDLEFTVRYSLATGERVGWLHNAKIYDEKPLKFKQSYVQRTRWMKGHFDCAFRYFKPLMKAIFKPKSLRSTLVNIDLLIYLVQPVRIVLSLSSFFFFLLSLFSPLPDYISTHILNPWLWGIGMGLYYGLPFWALFQEKQLKKGLWFIETYIFSMSWIPIVAYAFFKREEKTWSHTQHTRSVNVEAVLERGD